MLQIKPLISVAALPVTAGHSKRWRLGAIAGAIALGSSFVSLPVQALSLGRITVQSALGEPLRAEIDISDLSPQEASTLNARLGSVDAFKAAGLEFSQVLNGVEINLQRRPDGRSFLRLRGSRPIAEPFLDLLIQTNTANGSLSRDYAVLLDPPSLKQAAVPAAPAAVAAPAFTRPAVPSAVAQASEPTRPAAASTSRAPVARIETPARTVPAAATAAATTATTGARQVTVRPGETAGKLAAQHKAEDVSLDQMLLAMQRSNPEAFINGNVNRIKAGAVVNLPGAEAANVASPAEASQTILAQSKDFNAFRRSLAESVPNLQVAKADRAAGGSVTARVDDQAGVNATPDKLTLSKGAVQSKPGVPSEDTIARNRQASDASARLAELSKNISDLNKLGLGTAVTATGGASAAAPAPGLTLPVPSGALTAGKPAPVAGTTPAAASVAAPLTPVLAQATATASPAVPALSAPAATAASAAVAAVADANAASVQPPMTDSSVSAAALPAASAAVLATSQTVAAKPAAAPVPAPENGVLMSLLDNPLILPLGAGLLALLAGFGIYRHRRQKHRLSVDSSFLESRLQPDSFFGASGGQRIDTKEGSGVGSSLIYSPSQLDAAGDVDPVAEADVYLAYGRDLQAEEILKEALRTTPRRAAIHAKLCEIYAKRRDAKSFNAMATKAQLLTEGTGADWKLISAMGHELDATHPLYQDSAPAIGPVLTPSVALQAGPQTVSLPAVQIGSASATPPAARVSHDIDIDFDLDLDLDLDLDSNSALSKLTTPSPLTVTVASKLPSYVALPDLDLDFSSPPTKPHSGLVDLTPAPSSFINTYPLAAAASSDFNSVTVASDLSHSMLEFDLDSLSLDLGTTSTHASIADDSGKSAGDLSSENPLETKFLLAEEFRSLGDDEGARSLAQEVLVEAQGPLKAKAQAFMNTLV